MLLTCHDFCVVDHSLRESEEKSEQCQNRSHIRMHRYAISRKIQFLTGKGNELTKLIQLPVLIKLHVILQLHKNILT